MSFPLVRECIQSIGASQCEVMSVIDLRDAYHTLLDLHLTLNNIVVLHHIMDQILIFTKDYLWD